MEPQAAIPDDLGDEPMPGREEIEPGIPGPETAEAKPPGLVCPNCGCQHFVDQDGRPWDVVKTEMKFGFIRRTRRCRYCGRQVHTREVPEIRT